MAQYTASATAGDAPNLDPGMYDAVLLRVESKRVNGGEYTKDKVNGDPKLEWVFGLLDDDGDRILFVDAEGEVKYEDGDPVEVEVGKLTGVGFNIKSKTTPGEVKVLKALLTPAEYAAFENGEGTPDDEVDAPEGLRGRKAQVEVFIKESGWPGIGNVIAAKVARKAAGKK